MEGESKHACTDIIQPLVKHLCLTKNVSEEFLVDQFKCTQIFR